MTGRRPRPWPVRVLTGMAAEGSAYVAAVARGLTGMAAVTRGLAAAMKRAIRRLRRKRRCPRSCPCRAAVLGDAAEEYLGWLAAKTWTPAECARFARVLGNRGAA